MKFDDQIPINYKPASQPSPKSVEATVFGWGLWETPPTPTPPSLSLQLLQATIQVQACDHQNNKWCSPNNNYIGICTGDSGGPLMMRQPDSSLLLVGISSAYESSENKCAEVGAKSIFTALTPHLKKIEEVITPPNLRLYLPYIRHSR